MRSMFGLAKSKKSGLAFLTLIPAFLILSLIRSTVAPAHAPEPNVKRTEPELKVDLDHGAIVVLDPQTGRLRAVVNQELAFRTASPPGSTIKPFTALAALRASILTENTRIRCPGKYKRNDVVDACVHPPKLPAFNAAEAIAYSCNYFFATTGEHLDEEKFANMLGDFGFVVARGHWQPQSALGEGPFLQVTPVQMATAYAALFNGGALLTPNYDGVRKVRTQLHIDDKERALLLEGMRGAVSFGTAAKADLDSLPAYIIGKTGTSTQLGGFRSQGWFAGIAFKPNAPPDPENAQLVVVVYLNKAHGADAAELARPIFEEFAGQVPVH